MCFDLKDLHAPSRLTYTRIQAQRIDTTRHVTRRAIEKGRPSIIAPFPTWYPNACPALPSRHVGTGSKFLVSTVTEARHGCPLSEADTQIHTHARTLLPIDATHRLRFMELELDTYVEGLDHRNGHRPKYLI